jgi:hypothetical protein
MLFPYFVSLDRFLDLFPRRHSVARLVHTMRQVAERQKGREKEKRAGDLPAPAPTPPTFA